MATVEQALSRLQRSAFRAKFHLSEQDRQYIADKGMETIQRHAADFVRTRLAPASIPNDGKQTPMHAYVMPGKRYDIGDINSYEYVKSVFSK